MALPEGKQENFQIALYNYIEGRYSLTERYYQDTNNLDTTNINEWVEFSWRNVIGREFRNIHGKAGRLETLYFDALIRVKPTSIITRTTRIKDTLIDLLERVSLEVQDYVGGSSAVIGKIIGQGVESDYAMGVQDDISSHLLTFKFQFIRRFSRYTT